MRAYFCNSDEVLKQIGNQLLFLNINDVLDKDFYFISQNCRSLECFRLQADKKTESNPAVPQPSAPPPAPQPLRMV